jgi:predicted ATP-grasp superfamily ATP-dependent carboligase
MRLTVRSRSQLRDCFERVLHRVEAGEVYGTRSRYRAPAGRVANGSKSALALVLDAEQRQSLVAIRSLGRAGIPVAALACRAAPAFRSRWCTAAACVSDFAEDEESFVEDVLNQAQGRGARVLIPAHDGSIEALRRHRANVECHVRVALTGEEGLRLAVSKQRTLALAATIGIPTPRSIMAACADDAPAAVAELGLPLVVKPDFSWARRGRQASRLSCTVAVDLDETKRFVDALAAAGAGAVLQEWIPGAREAVSLFRAEGKVLARFAQVAFRMYPPLGGSSVVRKSISLPGDTTEAAELLVEAAGLDGYSEVEFRRDARNRPLLMEVNPRLSASVEIAVRAGVDFPLLLYRWAVGEPLRPVNGYRPGMRMRWLGGDIGWLRATLRTPGRPDSPPAPEAIRAFAQEFLRPATYDYVAADDLLPALSAAGSWAGGRLRGLADARSGS